MEKWFEGRLTRRILSLALSMVMVLSLLPMPSIAAEGDGLCEHHTEHTGCGYVAAVEGQECTHVCGEDCDTVTTDCQHVHDESCYSDGVLPAAGEEKAAACAHTACTEESGCVTKTHTCVHTDHDDSCGYKEAVAGSPCTFVCEECAGKEPEALLPAGDTVLTSWEWVDPDEWLDETGSFAMPGVTEDSPAYFEDVVEYLPTQITALIDGGEVTLDLGDWSCDDYPVETGTSQGEFVFTATLPEGYVLADGSNTLPLPVTVAPIDLSEGPDWGSYGEAPATYMGVTLEEPEEYAHAYQIDTVGKLYWFAWKVNEDGGTTLSANLSADITVNQNINANPDTLIKWKPIENFQARFSGFSEVNENFHTISGLYCDENLNAGLFSSISGDTTAIRNIIIKDSYFKSASGGGSVGAICAVQNGGSIIYCTNENSTCVTGSEQGVVGGIVGTMNSGIIQSCTNRTNLQSNSSQSIGGICGLANGGDLNLCVNSGTIQGKEYVGGICGFNKAQIDVCENTGAISGTDYVGGIAGFSGKKSGQNINRGSVTATGNYAGGICGYLDSHNPTREQNYGSVTGVDFVGGLYGECTGTVEACANYGQVQATGANIGALAGNVGVNMKDCLSYNAQNMSLPLVGNSIQITNSYYLAASDSAASTSGTPRTEEQFRSGQVTYLLNQGRSGRIWGQTLGTDAYPILGSNAIVYKYTGSPCPEEFYSNTDGETKNLEHDMSGDSPYCKRCGYGGEEALTQFNSSVEGKSSYYDGRNIFEHLQFVDRKNDYKVLSNCTFVWAKLTIDGEGPFVYDNYQDLPGRVGEYYGTIIIESNGTRYNAVIYSTATRDITPTRISVTWDDFDVTYDKQVHLPTYTLRGVVPGEDVRLQTQIMDGSNFIDAGTQYYKWTGTLLGKDAGNYSVNGEQRFFTIKKKTINSVTLKPKASYPFGEVKTYGWTPDWESPDVFDGDAPFEFDLQQRKSDDSWGNPTYPWLNQYNAGQYAVYVSGIDSKNYVLAEGVTGRAEFTITPLVLVTPESLPSSVYTGEKQIPTLPTEYKSTVNSLSVSFKNVGEHEVQLETRVNNYVWDSNGGKTKFTITPKDLAEEDVTLELLNASNLVYDGTEKKPTVRLSYGSDYPLSSNANCGFTVAYEDNIEGGEAKAIVTATQGGNYTGSRTLTFTIGQADNEWVTEPSVKDSFVYGDTNPVTYSAKYGNANVVVTHKKQGTSDNPSTGIPTDAGTYDLTVSLPETSSYTALDPENLTLTISPKSLSEDDIAIQVTNPTYTGTPLSPEVVVKYGEITLEEGKDYTLSGTGTVAGDYPFTVTLTGNYTGSKAQTFSIKQAASEGTAPKAVSDLTYTGQAQTLITAGSTSHGTMVYSLTKDGDYTANLPTGTGAGSYTVWYKILGDTNHLDSTPVSVTCSIAQKNLIITANNHAITYGDAPANNGVSYEGFVNGETEADLKGELTYSYDYEQFDDVGTGKYTITSDGLSSDNYDITFAPGTLTVNRKTIGITWSNTSLSYNGTAQAPTATATGLVNGDCDITVSGQQTNAGNYTATADSLSNSNYKLPENNTCDFSINKIAPEFTAPTGKTVLYDGTALELAEAGTPAGGTMKYSLDGKNWSKNIPTATEWGKYTVYYMVEGDGNHTNTEAQPVEAEIVPFKIQSQTEIVEIGYSNDAVMSVTLDTILDEQISCQWYQVTDEGDVALPGATAKELTISKPNAGKYTYVCKITCGEYSKFSDDVLVTVNAGEIQVDTETNEGLLGYWLEGGEAPAADGQTTVPQRSPSSRLLTQYTTTTNDQGGLYPTGMKVFALNKDNQPEEIPALENLLNYEGCSIRIVGQPGIRMITSLTKEAKELLKRGELEGYTLEEYGTVVQWADTLKEKGQSLTLSTGEDNYAYRKGVSDPVFANVGNMTQYTNVLIWDSLTDEQYAAKIAMRPYIILSSENGETVTLYGGTVERSIYDVAKQNADTFPVGSAGYNYVHDIIDRVDKPNSSTNSSTGGNVE